MTTAIISENTVRTFTGVQDTYLNESNPTTNRDGNNLQVTSFGSGDRANTIIRFNGLSNIVGPVTVSAVTLQLFIGDGNATRTVDVHKCLRAWVETQATWNIFATASNWGTSGGTSSGTDIVGTASASVSVVGAVHGVYASFSSAQMAADVQDWINNGNNNGWLLKRNDYSAFDSTFLDFTDSVNGPPTSAPILAVTYTAAGSTYTLTADQGSYALNGQASNLLYSRIMPAAQGNYALTGQTAALSYNTASVLTAVQGQYNLVGSDALVDTSMNADFGQYTLTGFAANLVYQQINAYTLVAGQGSYALTGFASNLLENRILTADKGQYNLTGQFNTMIWSGAPVVVGGQNRSINMSKLRIGL